MPSWWRHLNKTVFNPLAMKLGNPPLLTHVGRVTGATYNTPLDAYNVDGGYLFVLVYGANTDWVRNTLASGHARFTKGGREFDLVNPRLIGDDEAWQLLPDTVKGPPKFLNISQYLRMDVAER